VSACAPSKDLAQGAPEIIFTLCGFHCDFGMSPTLTGLRPVTTKQSWEFLVPLSREDVIVAESVAACQSFLLELR
jgi:hypothetical protein